LYELRDEADFSKSEEWLKEFEGLTTEEIFSKLILEGKDNFVDSQGKEIFTTP
jgi:hypothetical protein